MKYMYAPWRTKYVQKKQQKDEVCVFCTAIQSVQDSLHRMIYRSATWCILMNKYPYNAGHILMVPTNHVADLQNLSMSAQQEGFTLIAKTSTLLRTALFAQGINVGINMGKAAGASILDHLHVHILPRWEGDTNFLPTLARIKHVSVDIQTLYMQLKQAFQEHSSL